MYTYYVTPSERLACIKFGMLTKLAEHGLTQDQFAGMIKSSQSLSGEGVAKTMIAIALLTGIPLGALAHYAGQRISATQGKEKELGEKIKYYRTAAQDIESGLSSDDVEAQ